MNAISFLGSQILALSFPACLYSLLIYVIGWKKKRGDLIVSAGRATVLTFVLLTLAVALLIGAFLTDNFALLYVYGYSSKTLPLFYKMTGLWAGLDGSILFWTWLVSFYALILFMQHRKKSAAAMPFINGTMMFIILFFITLMLFANNPFTFNPMAEGGGIIPDGKGLNPLLQNIAMVVHPPALYLGFTGFSVPFAFAIAALINRRLDTEWIENSRRWTIVAWFFLTLGLILGGAWAYVELGWGGFWGWDPVENAALMPWLVATAYLHSVVTQKKRGMLQLWNVSLVVCIFMLTIFGTYLTRSGIVQSVHAFSESNLGPFFLFFLGFVFVFSFGLIYWRYKDLKSPNVLHSFFSKEAAFLVNNIVLLVATFAVLWGTLFPTISELVTGQRVTVGPGFFNQVMAPIGILLLALMGTGPMFSWKKTSTRSLKSNLLLPLLCGILLSSIAFITGIRSWYALATVLFGTVVLATLFLEFYRGLRIIKKQQKMGIVAACGELVLSNNRRYGGYIVHVGALFIFLGIAGQVFKTEADFSLLPGEAYEFAGYNLHYQSFDYKTSDHHNQLLTVVDLLEDGKTLKTLRPVRLFYHKSEQPTTEVDIYQAPLMDVYLIVGNLDSKTGRAEFRVTLNPLISNIWLGGFIILAGVVILLLPRGLSMVGRSASKKAILGLGLSLTLFGFAPNIMAQDATGPLPQHQHDVENGEDPFLNADLTDPSVVRLKNVTDQIICQCGGCVRMSLKSCPCGFAKEERKKIATAMTEGWTDEQIIDGFVAQHGLLALTLPPHRGFFEVGYWIPLMMLVVGLVGGIFVIRRLKSAHTGAQKQDLPKSLIEKFKKEIENP